MIVPGPPNRGAQPEYESSGARLPLAVAVETIRDTAAMTGVPDRTIRRWALSGRITYRKRAGVLLVKPLEVSELNALRQRCGRLPPLPKDAPGRDRGRKQT